jgi:predicted AlkP superfamily pyrophosphatase or phosphodiesterase
MRKLIFLLAVWSCLLSATAAEIPAKDRMVVMITVDGFPAWIWNDPFLPMPTLRKLAAEGAVAKGMRVSNPSVTWPNHTTLVTGVPPGKHGVLFNGLLLRPLNGQPTIEPWRDKKELVRVPTVYDLIFKAGMTTAQVDWIPVTNSGTFSWEFPERPNPNGVIEREMIKAGRVTEAEVTDFNKQNPPWRDMIWTAAATHIIKQHKPNFLLFHLLNTDAHNHKFGPGTWASLTAYAYADTCLREIVDAVAAAGMKDRTTFVIVTDHGFKTAKKLIRPNALFRQEGLLKSVGPLKVVCDAYSMSAGGTTMIYVTDPAKREELVPRLKKLLAPLEGVARVVEPSEYAALGLPSPKDNNQMGDLWLVAKPDYAFASTYTGDELVTEVGPEAYKGYHGYINTDPQLDGVFIASGRGIKPGARLERIDNTDVAPTVAALLGLKMPNVDGKVLDAILKK